MNVSASALPRLRLCLASGLLKQVDYQSDSGRAGDERHSEMEEAIVAGDLSKIPDEVLALIEGMDVRAEVSVVYDVATHTARELGAQLGRSYGTLKPFEVPGMLDMLAVGNGRAVVGDWKGWLDVDHPSDNWQTLLYALAVALIYELQTVTIAIAHIVEGNRNVYIADVDVLELDAYAEELRSLFSRAAKASTDPHAYEVPGIKQCRFCPAFLDCNTQKALQEQVKTDVIASQFNAVIPFENDEEAADAYELAQRIQLLLNRVKGALYARAKERPIPLRNGMMFGERESLGNRQLDGDKAYAMLREKYGQDIADQAVTREASQKGIEAALKKAGIKGAGKAKDEFLIELEKDGGVSRKRKVSIEEYPAQPQLKAANG